MREAATGAPAVVIAVPAHDEREHLPQCLSSVRRAVRHAGWRHAISQAYLVVVAHRCRDDTADVARGFVGPHLPGEVLVLDERADVGLVRDLAVRVGLSAAGSSHRDTWVFSTDADTTVRRDWIARALSEAAAARAVAVVGLASLDGWRGSPGGRTEYDKIVAAGMRRDDPVHAHDHVYGANLVVRADAYLAVGGFPHAGHGEDQRLVDALAGAGLPILRTRTVEVTTSGRLEGRAAHGLAELLLSLDQAERTPTLPRHDSAPAASRGGTSVLAAAE